jgi:hypothetical protein
MPRHPGHSAEPAGDGPYSMISRHPDDGAKWIGDVPFRRHLECAESPFTYETALDLPSYPRPFDVGNPTPSDTDFEITARIAPRT